MAKNNILLVIVELESILQKMDNFVINLRLRNSFSPKLVTKTSFKNIKFYIKKAVSHQIRQFKRNCLIFEI